MDRRTATSPAAGEWLQDEVARRRSRSRSSSLDTTVDAADDGVRRRCSARPCPSCKERSVCDLVGPAARDRRRPFERLPRRRVRLLHGRRPGRVPARSGGRARRRDRAPADATPCCVLYVAHARPGTRRRAQTSEYLLGPVSDWGHATELDDVRGEVAIVGHRRDRVHEGVGPHRARDRRRGRRARDRRRRPRAGRHRRPHVVGRVRRLRRRRVPRALRHDARDVDVAVGRRHGVGRRPRRTSPRRRSAQGEARHVLNVFPVAWATQRGVDDRRARARCTRRSR